MEILEKSIGVFRDAFDKPFCAELIRDCRKKIDPVLEQHGWVDVEQDGVRVANNPKRQDASLVLNHYGSLHRYMNSIEWVLDKRSQEYFEWFNFENAAPERYDRTPLSYRVWKVQYTPSGGGFSQMHFEQGGGLIDTATRYAVWMIYLNDVVEGGATDFPAQDLSIQPEQGTLVIWPAGYTHPHRSAPDLRQDKWIVTGWMLYDPHPEKEE